MYLLLKLKTMQVMRRSKIVSLRSLSVFFHIKFIMEVEC